MTMHDRLSPALYPDVPADNVGNVVQAAIDFEPVERVEIIRDEDDRFAIIVHRVPGPQRLAGPQRL